MDNIQTHNIETIPDNYLLNSQILNQVFPQAHGKDVNVYLKSKYPHLNVACATISENN